MPQITKVTVTAGRVIDHPTEPDVKLTPSVTLEAHLRIGESEWDATRRLQSTAEALVDEHRYILTEALIATQEIPWQETDLQDEIEGRQLKADAEFIAAHTREDEGAGAELNVDAEFDMIQKRLDYFSKPI